MISDPNLIQDRHILVKLREIIRVVNDLEPKVAVTSAAVSSMAIPTLTTIQQALQIGGTNPLNVNGLLGILANAQIAVKVGTHAQRLALAATVGATFFESDRTVFYVGTPSGNAAIWTFAAGTMTNTFANRPTDLGANDVNFNLYVTTGTGGVIYDHQFIWSGSVWRWNGDRAGIFVDAPVAPGDGFQLCDGSTTKYLSVGSDLSENSFTTPNLSGTGSPNLGTYITSIDVYTGSVNAPTVPTFAGTPATLTGSVTSTFTGTPATLTGSVTSNTFTVVGSNYTAGITPATITTFNTVVLAAGNNTVKVPDSTLTMNSYTPAGSISSTLSMNSYTPAGTISLPGDPVRNLGVPKYFRR